MVGAKANPYTTVLATTKTNPTSLTEQQAKSFGLSTKAVGQSSNASSTFLGKSLENSHFSETERVGIPQIIAELSHKTSEDIILLKLAPDVCQEIACRGVSSDMARRCVDAYDAQRSATAAEWSMRIAAVAAAFSLLSLLISGLAYRQRA